VSLRDGFGDDYAVNYSRIRPKERARHPTSHDGRGYVLGLGSGVRDWP